MTKRMTDLEFCLDWVDTQSDFINPFVLRELEARGLYRFVNQLKGTASERKAQVYARFAEAGRAFGEPEIDWIAGKLEQVKQLQRQIAAADPTDFATLFASVEQVNELAQDIQRYFSK